MPLEWLLLDDLKELSNEKVQEAVFNTAIERIQEKQKERATLSDLVTELRAMEAILKSKKYRKTAEKLAKKLSTIL
ncbi:MAG: hypothetical protein AAF443_00250 [Chlamydiota bacterium]